MSRALDPKVNGRYPFQYVGHASTDIRKTFAKELRRIATEKAEREAAQAEQTVKVRKLKTEKTA